MRYRHPNGGAAMTTEISSITPQIAKAVTGTHRIAGGRVGVLLLHGLCGTPAEMRFVAHAMGRAGYTVHCPLLAGHGAGQDEITKSSWQDWYASAEDALNELRETCDTVIVGGLCVGAILSLQLAARNPDKVQSVALFSPTLWVNGWAIKWYMRLLALVPFRWLAKLIHFKDVASLGIKCPRVRAFVQAALASPGMSEMGMSGTPASVVLQHRWLVKATRRLLGEVRQPTLIVHSREDDHADLNNATYLQRNLPGTVDLVVLEDSYHMITLDKERHIVVERTTAFVKRTIDALTGVRNADDAQHQAA